MKKTLASTLVFLLLAIGLRAVPAAEQWQVVAPQNNPSATTRNSVTLTVPVGTVCAPEQYGQSASGAVKYHLVDVPNGAGVVAKAPFECKLITIPDPTYALNVTVTGQGTVSSAPAGISCGTDCAESYNSGTAVALTATPATGNSFSGWSGDCTGTGPCNVTMTAARAVTATFTADTPPPPSGSCSGQTPDGIYASKQVTICWNNPTNPSEELSITITGTRVRFVTPTRNAM